MAHVFTDDERSRAGKATAKKLTRKQRVERARKASQAAVLARKKRAVAA